MYFEVVTKPSKTLVRPIRSVSNSRGPFMLTKIFPISNIRKEVPFFPRDFHIFLNLTPTKKEKAMEIQILTTQEQTQSLLALAGNSKSFDFPCRTIPKAITSLMDSEPYTGHDLVLGLIPVLINAELTKPFRTFLLFLYGRHLNISSQSLMHKNLANLPLNQIPSSFAYGLSIVTNLRLLKRMVADLQNFLHIQEIHDFTLTLSLYLTDTLGMVEPKKSNLILDYLHSDGTQDLRIYPISNYYEIHFLSFDISFIEQLLRYTSNTLFTKIEHPNNLFSDYYITDNKISLVGLFTKQQIKTIVEQRRNHKLPQWRRVCEEFESRILNK